MSIFFQGHMITEGQETGNHVAILKWTRDSIWEDPK
jgi:hypothetical protein